MRVVLFILFQLLIRRPQLPLFDHLDFGRFSILRFSYSVKKNLHIFDIYLFDSTVIDLFAIERKLQTTCLFHFSEVYKMYLPLCIILQHLLIFINQDYVVKFLLLSWIQINIPTVKEETPWMFLIFSFTTYLPQILQPGTFQLLLHYLFIHNRGHINHILYRFFTTVTKIKQLHNKTIVTRLWNIYNSKTPFFNFYHLTLQLVLKCWSLLAVVFILFLEIKAWMVGMRIVWGLSDVL